MDGLDGEESKDNIKSPDKEINTGDDSLFALSLDAKREKSGSMLSKDGRHSIEMTPAQKLARRRTVVHDKTAPHITNLHEDEQMSGLVFFPICKEGKTELNVGRKTGNPVPDVILGAIGIKSNHASIKLD